MKRLAIVVVVASCGTMSNALPGSTDAAASDAPTGDIAAPEAAMCDAAAGRVGTDGATGAGEATTYFIDVLRLQNGLCLPQSLPVDGAGNAACQVFLALASGDTCAAHAGLSAVAADVAASIRSAEPVSASQPLCALAQLPAVCGSCATSSKAGWCYLTGSAAGNCRQTLVVSPSAAVPTGATALLGCGATSSSSTGSSSAASVGSSCVPSPELSASFAGFTEQAVTLDENNTACSGAVCLVNHFRGLTACPYGQDANGNPFPPITSACSVPGTSTPVKPNDPKAGNAVLAQCLDRRASRAVYCSCRCANAEGSTNDGATYCTCPSGYACTQVVPAIQSGDPRAGSYCIQNGTAYDPSNACSAECSSNLGNCP